MLNRQATWKLTLFDEPRAIIRACVTSMQYATLYCTAGQYFSYCLLDDPRFYIMFDKNHKMVFQALQMS